METSTQPAQRQRRGWRKRILVLAAVLGLIGVGTYLLVAHRGSGPLQPTAERDLLGHPLDVGQPASIGFNLPPLSRGEVTLLRARPSMEPRGVQILGTSVLSYDENGGRGIGARNGFPAPGFITHPLAERRIYSSGAGSEQLVLGLSVGHPGTFHLGPLELTYSSRGRSYTIELQPDVTICAPASAQPHVVGNRVVCESQ